MRIAFVLESFFPESKAGTEQYVFQLLKKLQDRHIEVSVLCTTADPSNSYKEIYEGTNVFRIGIAEVAEKAEIVGLMAPKNMPSFMDVITQLKPDIVHFHTFNRKINYYHLIAAKKAGFKTVFTSHLAGIFCLKGSLMLFNEKSCDGQVKKLRCFSCFLHDKDIPKPIAQLLSVASILPQKVKRLFPVLHIVDYRKKELEALSDYCDATIAIAPWAKSCFEINGVANSKLVLQGTEMRFENTVIVKKRKISIGFIGRMYPIKGLHLMLDALLMMDSSSFILKIIYLSSDEMYLKRIKEKVNRLYNPCIMHSNQSPEQVEKLLEQLDILCVPSIVAEMAPLVILEAFSKRIPVIGSNHGGIKDMIKHEENGLLFENNNVKSLTQCLQRFLEEPDLLPRLQSNIQPPRSFEDVAEDMMGIYKSII